MHFFHLLIVKSTTAVHCTLSDIMIPAPLMLWTNSPHHTYFCNLYQCNCAICKLPLISAQNSQYQHMKIAFNNFPKYLEAMLITWFLPGIPWNPPFCKGFCNKCRHVGICPFHNHLRHSPLFPHWCGYTYWMKVILKEKMIRSYLNISIDLIICWNIHFMIYNNVIVLLFLMI